MLRASNNLKGFKGRLLLLSLKKCFSLSDLIRLINSLIIALEGELDNGMCFSPKP